MGNVLEVRAGRLVIVRPALMFGVIKTPDQLLITTITIINKNNNNIAGVHVLAFTFGK